jgi:hypothetical protein
MCRGHRGLSRAKHVLSGVEGSAKHALSEVEGDAKVTGQPPSSRASARDPRFLRELALSTAEGVEIDKPPSFANLAYLARGNS